MSELTKLKEAYTELGKRIKALESKGGEWPCKGDWYWYVHDWGWAAALCGDTSVDKARQAQGNCFKISSQAEATYEYNKVVGELLHCKGRVPFKVKTINHCISFNFERMDIAATGFSCNTCGVFNIYFESSQAVNAAIKEVGKDRIIAAAKWQATRPVY